MFLHVVRWQWVWEKRDGGPLTESIIRWATRSKRWSEKLLNYYFACVNNRDSDILAMKSALSRITHHNNRWRRERFLLDFLDDAEIVSVSTSRCECATGSPLLLDTLIAADLNATLHRHRLLRVWWGRHGSVGDLFDFVLVRALREGAFVLRDNWSVCHFHGLRVDFENSEMLAFFKNLSCAIEYSFEVLLCLKFNGRIVNYFLFKQRRELLPLDEHELARLTHGPFCVVNKFSMSKFFRVDLRESSLQCKHQLRRFLYRRRISSRQM